MPIISIILLIAVIAILTVLYVKAKKNNKVKSFLGGVALFVGFILRYYWGTVVADQDLLTPIGIDTKAQMESYYPIAYFIIIVGIILIFIDNKNKEKSKEEK